MKMTDCNFNRLIVSIEENDIIEVDLVDCDSADLSESRLIKLSTALGENSSVMTVIFPNIEFEISLPALRELADMISFNTVIRKLDLHAAKLDKSDISFLLSKVNRNSSSALEELILPQVINHRYQTEANRVFEKNKHKHTVESSTPASRAQSTTAALADLMASFNRNANIHVTGIAPGAVVGHVENVSVCALSIQIGGESSSSSRLYTAGSITPRSDDEIHPPTTPPPSYSPTRN